MFKKLIKWLSMDSTQRRAEEYIVSKNPKSPAEVDYWSRRYDQMIANSRFL